MGVTDTPNVRRKPESEWAPRVGERVRRERK
jgi:hypothetical protein